MTETTTDEITDTNKYPELNVPLIEHIARWVIESAQRPEELVQIDGFTEPDSDKPLLREWNQRTWHCGTACCFAGAAVISVGAKPLVNSDTSATEVRTSDGGIRRIESYAREILGLTSKEDISLFNLFNNVDDILERLHEIAANRGVTLDLPQSMPERKVND